MSDYRKGINQSEVNNTGIAYISLTTIILAFIASQIGDSAVYGFITFVVLLFVFMTPFGQYMIYGYSIGWAAIAFKLSSGEGMVVAIIAAVVAGFLTLNLGYSAKEFYDDVNEYDD